MSRWRTVIIIDEAQNLPTEALEELRLLSNVNTDQQYLVQLVLVGQLELLERLQEPQMRQFVQRVGVNYHLEPLTLHDTNRYIRHRLTVAGGNPATFDDDACTAVYYFCKGVPRLVNALCELALVFGFADGKSKVGMDTIIDVAIEQQKSRLHDFRAIPANLDRNDIEISIRSFFAPVS